MSKLRRFGTGRSLAAQPKTIMRFGDDVDVTRVRTTTVAVMPMREAMALGSHVKMMRTDGPGGLKMAIKKAVTTARKMSPTGVVTLTGTGPYAALSNKQVMAVLAKDVGKLSHRRAAFGPVSRYYMPAGGRRHSAGDLGVELGSDPDGTPVIIIVTPTEEIPTYRVTHVVRKKQQQQEEETKRNGGGGGTPPTAGHQFLKAPWTDSLLTEAMTVAARDLLDEHHADRVKWEEGSDCHIKQYKGIHLLVCLLYYVTVNGLGVEGTGIFYYQRKQFHEYCTSHLPEDFGLGVERNFRKHLQKLEANSCSFSDYLKAKEKPLVVQKDGETNLNFWYAVYCKAAESFDKVFKAKATA